MKIQSVFDDAFRTYGRVVDSYDYSLLLERLKAEYTEAGRQCCICSIGRRA